MQITYLLFTDVRQIRQGDQWHYIAKTIAVFVLAYRYQDPVILGIMEAQFIKIDVEENIAGLERCCLLRKAAVVLYVPEKAIWVRGSSLRYFALLVFPSSSAVTTYLPLRTQLDVSHRQ